MGPVQLAQSFLFDLVVCAHQPGFLDPTTMTARARDLARELVGREEPAVVAARRFLSGVGYGVLTIDAESGAQARVHGVALEPIAWPAATLAAPTDQEDTMSTNTGGDAANVDANQTGDAGAVPNTGDAANEQRGGASQGAGDVTVNEPKGDVNVGQQGGGDGEE